MVAIPPIVYNSSLKKKLMNDPVYAQRLTAFRVKDIYKDEFFSNSPPSIFVGSRYYPEANVGVLSPPERKNDVSLYDDQKYWVENNLDIGTILHYRSQLINSRFRTDVTAVRSPDHKFLTLAREIGMSKTPVDTEVKLKKKIRLNVHFDDTSLPMGPRGNLTQLKIGNTKIPQHIDKVYADTDMKTIDAINYLQKHDYNEHTLSQLMSIGVFGQKNKRVLVPTRWSITATHSLLANEKLSRIKQYPLLDEYCFFSGNYLGNYYFIMLFPDMYAYELFETYMPGSFWNPTMSVNISTDFEPFKGRTAYVEQTAGGFYATRLGLTEYLDMVKRQASLFVFRVESPEYWAGLGVWVVLEAVRKTLKNKPIHFHDKTQLITFFKQKIFEAFKFDVHETLMNSKLMEHLKQKRLSEF